MQVHEVTDRPPEQAERDRSALGDALEKERPQQEGPQAEAFTQALLQAWMTLAQQALATGSQLSTILRLELKLAIADSGRLLLAGVAMLLVAMLSWVGLCVLFAWFVFAMSASVPGAIAAFLLLQFLALFLLWLSVRTLRRSLRLPVSRRQLHRLFHMSDNDGTKTAGNRATDR